VLFSGLAEGETYVAAGVVDGRTMSVRFATDPPAPATIAARLDALEAAVPQKAAQSDLTAHTAASTVVHGRANTSALEAPRSPARESDHRL
jgi:hypothetical protein